MNALRLSTFLDRFRNSYVDLDDIIEENATQALNDSARPLNEFYLMLYFTANWLPSAFNKCLNNRLEEFLASNERNNVQLILISSDKTKDSYYEFLNQNKFIRYSLIFHEQDIKNDLSRHFKISGIPYLTVVKLELDANFKITDLNASRTNIKSVFLNDKDFKSFPWLNQPEIVNAETTADNTCTELKSILIEGKKSGAKRSRKRAEKVSHHSYALNEIYENLVHFRQSEKEKSIEFRKANFMFVLFGSCENQLNERIVKSLSEFWRVFYLKHKFFVVYLEFGNNGRELKLDDDVNWFTIHNDELKRRVALLYNVSQVPNLVIVDTKLGNVLNSSLRLQLIKYVDEFCKEKLDKAKRIESMLDENVSYESDQSQSKPNTNGKETDSNERHKLNFDLSIRNFLQKKIFHSSCELRPVPCLKTELLEGLKANLMDIYTMSKIQLEEAKEPNTESLYPNAYFLVYFCSNSTTSNSNLCEKIVRFAEQMRDQIECDIKLVIVSSDGCEQDYQVLLEKLRTNTQFVAKHEEKEEIQQHERNEKEAKNKMYQIARLSLDFACKQIKENLIKQLNVLSIPWFSLINAANGDILCKNLKVFFLHEELRQIVF